MDRNTDKFEEDQKQTSEDLIKAYNKFEEDQTQILEDLKEAYKKTYDNSNVTKLIPFIGAGFSKNISNYPGWDEFVKKLSKNLDEKFGMNLNIFKSNNLEACECFIFKHAENSKNNAGLNKNHDFFKEGKKKLVDIIKKVVDDNKRGKFSENEWKSHDLMVEKFDYIYTTNWDNTLESSAKELKKEIHLIYNENTFLDKNDKENTKIIKLHGHYEDPDSIVACQKDYHQRIMQENPLDIKFKNDLLHYHFMFIGYNFDDPNILIMIRLIQYLTEKISPEAKVNQTWISIEDIKDFRVKLLKKSLKIKPYYLLTFEQQYYLDKLNKNLKNMCESCDLSKFINTKENRGLCTECQKNHKDEIECYQKGFIREQTEKLLKEFQRKE